MQNRFHSFGNWEDCSKKGTEKVGITGVMEEGKKGVQSVWVGKK